MNKDFKTCCVSHDKVYLSDSDSNTYLISMVDLLQILKNADLRATKQTKHFKLEVN